MAVMRCDFFLCCSVSHAVNKCFCPPLRLPPVFGPSPSQLVLIWFLWSSFLFCFVFNNSQIFVYSFIKSL